MEPEEFSLLWMYGDKEVFEQRYKEGFSHVAFGSGPWVPDIKSGLFVDRNFPFLHLAQLPFDVRMVGMYVFYETGKLRVATLESMKFDFGEGSVRAKPVQNQYCQCHHNHLQHCSKRYLSFHPRS